MVSWKQQGIVFVIAVALASFHMWSNSGGVGSSDQIAVAARVLKTSLNQKEFEIVQGRNNRGESKIVVLRHNIAHYRTPASLAAVITEVRMNPQRRRRLEREQALMARRKQSHHRRKPRDPRARHRRDRGKGGRTGRRSEYDTVHVPMLTFEAIDASLEPVRDLLVREGLVRARPTPDTDSLADDKKPHLGGTQPHPHANGVGGANSAGSGEVAATSPNAGADEPASPRQQAKAESVEGGSEREEAQHSERTQGSQDDPVLAQATAAHGGNEPSAATGAADIPQGNGSPNKHAPEEVSLTAQGAIAEESGDIAEESADAGAP